MPQDAYNFITPLAMDYLSLFLWILIGFLELPRVSGEHVFLRGLNISIDPDIGNCGNQYYNGVEALEDFAQVHFKIYTSLEEAEAACREGEAAYRVLLVSLEHCRKSIRPLRQDYTKQMTELSPIIKGSSRLLKDFCGSNSESCCALRNDYLKHSSCYKDHSERLEECNAKYRWSLDRIQNIEGELEQKKQRFCSVKWFGKCMKSTAQKYCGKAAANVFMSYAVKAGKPAMEYLMENEDCNEDYAYGTKISKICESVKFEWCRPEIDQDEEFWEWMEDSPGEKDAPSFLTVCTAIRNSLGCLSRQFKRCPFGVLGGMKYEEECDWKEVKEGVPERLNGGSARCLLFTAFPKMAECHPDIGSGIKNTTHVLPFAHYNRYFCGVYKHLEKCWLDAAESKCGKKSREVMSDIIEQAAEKINSKLQCQSYDFDSDCKRNKSSKALPVYLCT